MKNLKIKITLFTLSAAAAVAVIAEQPIPNRLIDYKEFQRIVASSADERESHRLTERQFITAMADRSTVLLDARTALKYDMRHIRGAVNLPFTDFTAETLAGVIPDKGTKILIYCNNNFEGAQRSFPSKSASASLNLSTYTSLKSYGYTNIYELGPLLNVNKTEIRFDGTETK